MTAPHTFTACLPLKHAVCQSAHNIGKLQLSVRSLALALLVATETNGLVKFYGRCFSRALIVSADGLRARSFVFGVPSQWQINLMQNKGGGKR